MPAGRDFGRDPAAEREADQRNPIRQRVEHVAPEMHEIVNRLEILGKRRAAEARHRRRDDLAVFGQKIDKRRLRADRVDPVHEQDRPPAAAPQHFELERPGGSVSLTASAHPDPPPQRGRGKSDAAPPIPSPAGGGGSGWGIHSQLISPPPAAPEIRSRPDRPAADPAIAAAPPSRPSVKLFSASAWVTRPCRVIMMMCPMPPTRLRNSLICRATVSGLPANIWPWPISTSASRLVGRGRREAPAAPRRRRHLGRDVAGLEFRHLRRALDADRQEPRDLLADPQRLLVGVADIGRRPCTRTGPRRGPAGRPRARACL